LVAASRRSSPVERVLSTAEAERAQLQAVLQSVPGGVSGNVAVERPDVSAEGNLIKQVIKTVPRAAGAPQPSSLQEANILQSVLRSVKGNQ
jgi:type IV secretory pathway VirB2 component (pilin)